MSNGSKGRRTFGSIRRLPSGRWQARYQDRSGRTQTAPNTFVTKADAARYLALVEADLTRNVFHDPRKGRTPFRTWAEMWFETLPNLRPTTRGQYRYLLKKLVEPTFGEMALADIDPVAVRAWLAELEARPSISQATAAEAYRMLRRILASAVEADYLVKNPCTLKRAGVERSPEMRFATPEQVNVLVSKVPERYRALVLVAAYGGLRWGELANLRRRNVDPRRGTVQVVEQVVELRGKLAVGAPKSEAGRRTVMLPPSLRPALQEHQQRWAEPGPDGLVFPAPEGGFLRQSNFRRRVWLKATKAAGLQGLRFHDLRHTAATLAVVAGATTKKLMARMGHATPAMAIRTSTSWTAATRSSPRRSTGSSRQAAAPSRMARRWHGVSVGVGLARRKGPLTRAGRLWS